MDSDCVITSAVVKQARLKQEQRGKFGQLPCGKAKSNNVQRRQSNKKEFRFILVYVCFFTSAFGHTQVAGVGHAGSTGPGLYQHTKNHVFPQHAPQRYARQLIDAVCAFLKCTNIVFTKRLFPWQHVRFHILAFGHFNRSQLLLGKNLFVPLLVICLFCFFCFFVFFFVLLLLFFLFFFVLFFF